MWDTQKHSRFQYLSQGQQNKLLTEAEQAELALLVQELEADEAGYLASATNRLRQQREALESQNGTLEVLARRKEALAQRLRDFLAQTQTERRVIESELAAVLASTPGPHTDE